MSGTNLNIYKPSSAVNTETPQASNQFSGVDFNINSMGSYLTTLVTVLSGLIIPFIASVIAISNTWRKDRRTKPLYDELVRDFETNSNLKKLIATLNTRKKNFNNEGINTLKYLYTITKSRNNRNTRKLQNLQTRYENYLKTEVNRLKKEKRSTTNTNQIENINNEIEKMSANNATGHFSMNRVVHGKNFPENWNDNTRYVPLHNTKFIKFMANEGRARKNQAEMDIDELAQTMGHLTIAAWGYFRMSEIMAENSDLLLNLDMAAVTKMGKYTHDVYAVLRATAPTLARAKVVAGAKMAQGALYAAKQTIPTNWRRTRKMINRGGRLITNRSVLLGAQMGLAAGTSAFQMLVDPAQRIKEITKTAFEVEKMAKAVSKSDFFTKLWTLSFNTAKEYQPSTIYAAQSFSRSQLEAVNLMFYSMGIVFKGALWSAAKPVAAAGAVSAYLRSQQKPGVARRNARGEAQRNMIPATRAITALRYRGNGRGTLRLTNGRNYSSNLSNNNRNNNSNNSGNNANINSGNNDPRSLSSNNNSNNNST